MNAPSLILAVVALVIFLAEALRPRPVAWLPLGLAFLTAAFIALNWLSGIPAHHWSVG